MKDKLKIEEKNQKKIIQLAYEKRYFKYHCRHITTDSFGRHLCTKITQYFETSRHIDQALWVYHNANKMFIKTLELNKYPANSRDYVINARHLLALKGFIYRDLIEWEKTG